MECGGGDPNVCKSEAETAENSGSGQEYLMMPITVEPMVTQPETEPANSIETITIPSSSNDTDGGELELSRRKK